MFGRRQFIRRVAAAVLPAAIAGCVDSAKAKTTSPPSQPADWRKQYGNLPLNDTICVSGQESQMCFCGHNINVYDIVLRFSRLVNIWRRRQTGHEWAELIDKPFGIVTFGKITLPESLDKLPEPSVAILAPLTRLSIWPSMTVWLGGCRVADSGVATGVGYNTFSAVTFRFYKFCYAKTELEAQEAFAKTAF